MENSLVYQMQATIEVLAQALAIYKVAVIGLFATNIITAIALFNTLRGRKVQQSNEQHYDSANDSPQLDRAA